MLSVVIPIYNEESRLRETLREVGRAVADLAGAAGYEIVCSDDGSTDRSPAIAEELSGELPIRLLRSEQNQGKGAAVLTGMLAARGDPVFFFDADLSTPLREMPGFLGALEDGCDVVIGTRKHPQARIERPQPWLRVHLGLMYTRLVNLLLGTQFSDYTCGFKAFRRAAARGIFERCLVQGWSFDAEILFLASRLGLRVREIPVHWIDDPDSKVRVFRAIAASFRELLEIRRHHLRGRYRIPAPDSSDPPQR